MLKIDFHQPKTCRATVTGGYCFVTLANEGATATAFLSIEQAREVVANLTRGLAEHDLIAKAKAEAAAQAEAA